MYSPKELRRRKRVAREQTSKAAAKGRRIAKT
jgi:hypothetical protein